VELGRLVRALADLPLVVPRQAVRPRVLEPEGWVRGRKPADRVQVAQVPAGPQPDGQGQLVRMRAVWARAPMPANRAQRRALMDRARERVPADQAPRRVLVDRARGGALTGQAWGLVLTGRALGPALADRVQGRVLVV
jgi:hypothetical protein